MKKLALILALICSTTQVFAHSSGNSKAQGCHKHAPSELPHCH
ncbi:hypothetical protein [Acinetobacter indicus]|uniref:YHYH domain-containing protein n=1 Tax=Acinetobacter indicus TaxID=756892 RepID=A0AAW8Z3Z6_9GAMM|nr:hypothetical protein [Acinetobacter indicus]MDV4316701.1 hypothetical protein [Acinetobacter indicus]